MRLNINKFIYTGIFCCLIYTCVGAQSIERKSVQLPQISELKSKLTSATGWVLGQDDQWTENKNSIPGSSKNYKVASQSFISWHLREVTIGDKIYSLLLKHVLKGRYRYPELQMDFYTFEALDWYVFDKAKLEKIIDTKTGFDKSYGVDLEVLYSGSSPYYESIDSNFTSTLKGISSSIQSQAGRESSYKENLSVAVFPVIYKEKKLVRFLFLSGYSASSFQPGLFDEAYFEVDYDVFYKFIRY